MERYFILVLLPTGPLPRVERHLTDAWNNWDYDEGRSMRFPSVLNEPCSDETVYVVLYECEFWALTLREGHRVRVFEKRVLRRIYGPKRDKVTGGWRKLA
jgi:hypothetical protein